MKILLIGEYSRLHNSLKEGLTALGHTVTIVSTGDNFKNYPTDLSIHPSIITGSFLSCKIRNGLYRLTGFDLEKTEKGMRFYFLLPKLEGYDHVQLINSDAIETHPAFERKLYKKLFSQNKKMNLLVCGDETPVVDYYLSGKMPWQILTPYLKNPKLKQLYSYSLKYITKNYRKLFGYVAKQSSVLITSDLDYKIPMEQMGYNVVHIPNPVNIDKIAYRPARITDKVVIFLGINRLSYIKKGITHFEEALQIIKRQYADKIEIIIAENTPYAKYLQLYERAHIVLDYTYGMDQGYNALEAMAAGKVVFTGAGAEFMQYYALTERVAIHAIPDANAIAAELANLIENPAEIEAISARARAFIEKEHHYVEVAKRYVEAWKK